MQKCLHDQIGKNVQVYVDDIVIKTKEKHTLLDDLKKTFANLRKFRNGGGVLPWLRFFWR